MSIQSKIGVQNFQGANRIAPKAQAAATPPAAKTSAGSTTPPASDKVTISNAAKALASTDGSAPAPKAAATPTPDKSS